MVFIHNRLLLCIKKCKLESSVRKYMQIEIIMLSKTNQTCTFKWYLLYKKFKSTFLDNENIYLKALMK